MITVHCVYNPQRREYFQKGLATLIDCSRVAIKEYNKAQGTEYEFVELGDLAFSQPFYCYSENWVIYTIDCVAFHNKCPEPKDDDYFIAKVFCGPNYNATSYVFYVLEINLSEKADSRFHKLLPYPPEVVYDPDQNISTKIDLPCPFSSIAIEEYTDNKNSTVRLLHVSREILYGGKKDCWLYTMKFDAITRPSEVIGTFTVQVVHGLERDESSACVLNVKFDAAFESVVGVECPKFDTASAGSSSSRRLIDEDEDTMYEDKEEEDRANLHKIRT